MEPRRRHNLFRERFSMFRGEQLAQSAMRAAETEALRSSATVQYNGGPG